MNKYDLEIIAKLEEDHKFLEMDFKCFTREWRRLDDELEAIKDKESISANLIKADKSAAFERLYELDKKCTALLNAIDKLNGDEVRTQPQGFKPAH